MSVNIYGPAPVRRSTQQQELSPARARLLEYLQQQQSPMRTSDVAQHFGQHPNTVREHLDELVALGLATRRAASASGRGRPAWLYQADPDHAEPDPRVREYGSLAAALAGHVARNSTDPEGDARLAGETWGRSLAQDAHPQRPLATPQQARRATVRMLADLGFDPRSDRRVTNVALRRCPLLDVAQAYPAVVCQVHLGLVRGALSELGGDPERTDLIPFAEPGACRLQLRTPAQV